MSNFINVRISTSSHTKTKNDLKHNLRKVKSLSESKDLENIYLDKNGKKIDKKELYKQATETLKKWREQHNELNKKYKQNRQLRDNQSTLINGVFTFSEQLQKDYEDGKISEEDFIKKGVDLLNEISKKMGSEVLYLTLHRDEKTLHFHFHLKNFDEKGNSIFYKNRTKEKLSQLQDLGGEHFKEFGIKRGIKKEVSNSNNVSLKEYWEKEISKIKNEIKELRESQRFEIENLKKLREEIKKSDLQIEEKKEIYSLITEEQKRLRESNKKLQTSLSKLKKDTIQDTKEIISNIPIFGTGGDELKKLIKQKLFKSHKKEIEELEKLKTQNELLKNENKEIILKGGKNRDENNLLKIEVENLRYSNQNLKKENQRLKNDLKDLEKDLDFNYIEWKEKRLEESQKQKLNKDKDKNNDINHSEEKKPPTLPNGLER